MGSIVKLKNPLGRLSAMLSLNFTSPVQNSFGSNLNNGFGPNIGGFSGAAGLGAMNGADFGAGAMQSLMSQTMTSMSTAMMTLMAQMMTQQVAMLGRSLFGSKGAKGFGSPLTGFLGGANGATNLSGGNGPYSSQRIPGGKSLYSKGKGMFHKGAPGAPNTYAFENSPAGIAFAAKNGYASIDLDMQITKDGVPVATHWSQPLKKDGFYDPLGKIGKDKKVKDMTLAEVMRLRNKDGRSQIYPVSTMIQHLKQNGIAGDFEAKNDPRFATDKIMGTLANQVRAAGIRANLKSIHRGPGTDKILKEAQQHGFYVRIALAKDGQKKYWGYGG